MDLSWGSGPANQFVTNVGLITSHGPHGHNVMACEWTHQVSYSPGLIAVCINPKDATHDNIAATKEFGVSLCADDQNVPSSVAGGSTGRTHDKIAALKELGYEFFPGAKTKVLLVKGAALNVECKLMQAIPLGDHTMFVGEAVAVHPVPGLTPLAYHNQKYWRLGTPIQKPAPPELDRIRRVVDSKKK